jgi:hypothetical protein
MTDLVITMGTTPRQGDDGSERGIDQVKQVGAPKLECVWAEALFVSDAQRSDHLTPDQIRAAVQRTVRRYGAVGVAALVASEFGDHPDTAVGRMSWALCEVRTSYPDNYSRAA